MMDFGLGSVLMIVGMAAAMVVVMAAPVGFATLRTRLQARPHAWRHQGVDR